MDEVIRIKAEKKKEAEEKIAYVKRLKALYKTWTTLYNQTLVELRKWGPEMLQKVEDYVLMDERLAKASKALKTLKAGKKKPLPDTPLIKYTLPNVEFPNIPPPPVKIQSTALLSPLLISAPSPLKQRSPIKRRQRARKIKEVIEEAIQPLETVTLRGRTCKRRLFYNEVLINTLIS
jgi:hypothetical protein